MCELFCGWGGWSRGFMHEGWDCIGIDINPQPYYPGRFIRADIAQLAELPAADFYCCSSPCEQFSLFGMRCFHAFPPWPLDGIALFEGSRALLDRTGKPYVMENVKAAQYFLGTARAHAGSFYLWGNGVPAIVPKGLTKGFQHWKVRKFGAAHSRHGAALAAFVPIELSRHVAQTARWYVNNAGTKAAS